MAGWSAGSFASRKTGSAPFASEAQPRPAVLAVYLAALLHRFCGPAKVDNRDAGYWGDAILRQRQTKLGLAVLPHPQIIGDLLISEAEFARPSFSSEAVTFGRCRSEVPGISGAASGSTYLSNSNGSDVIGSILANLRTGALIVTTLS
jgi:hypothetical protein